MRLQFKIPKFETAHPEKEETMVNIAGVPCQMHCFLSWLQSCAGLKFSNTTESTAPKETRSMAIRQGCPSDLRSRGLAVSQEESVRSTAEVLRVSGGSGTLFYLFLLICISVSIEQCPFCLS